MATNPPTHQHAGLYPRPGALPAQAGQASAGVCWSQAPESILVFLLAALLLLAADVASLRIHSGAYRVEVGNYRDKFFLLNANYQEASEGTTYRWSTERSTLALGAIDVAPHALLTLELGGRPQPGELLLTLNEQPWARLTAATAPRHYILLLPPNIPDRVAIGLESVTFTPPGDSRRLGVKIEGFGLSIPRSSLPLPTPTHYLSQVVLILAAQLTVLRLGGRWQTQALAAAALAIGLAVLLGTALLLTYAYLPRLAVASVALAGLTWTVLPLLERKLAWAGDRREIRLLWSLMLLACCIRLVGVLYPTFDGQDLGRNVNRLIMAIKGQMIIIAGSSEFAKGLTIYPTGPYLAVMPALTLTNDLYALMEGAITLLEGSSALAVALLVRQLGGGKSAARMALVLYAGNLASFSGLVYCFSAQLFGQWLTAPIALLLLAAGPAPRLRIWGLAILLVMIGVYSHIGVAILAVTWMSIMLLLKLRRPSRAVLPALGIFAAGGLLALGLLYIDIAPIMLGHAASNVVGAEKTGLLPGATTLLLKGMRLAYSDLGLALLPLGALLIARAPETAGRRWVPLAALLTALLFLLVDLVLAVQVRYFYFALPFALATIGIALGRIAALGRWAHVLAWALTLFIAADGITQWLSTAFGNGGISMTPLTH